MFILAVDPGNSTGVVMWDSERQTVEHVCTLRLWRGLDVLLASADVVVYESFKLFPHLAREQTGSDFPSCQVIGVIRYLVETMGVGAVPPSVVVQQPSNQAKSLFKEGHLKAWGFQWGSPHELSAIRHLCYYLYHSEDNWLRERLVAIA